MNYVPFDRHRNRFFAHARLVLWHEAPPAAACCLRRLALPTFCLQYRHVHAEGRTRYAFSLINVLATLNLATIKLPAAGFDVKYSARRLGGAPLGVEAPKHMP